MSQYRKWHNVRNQPQFNIHSPLHSNPPVRPDAEFIRGHYRQIILEGEEISNAEVQGIVDGDPVLVVGHIIQRFVDVYLYLSLITSSFVLSYKLIRYIYIRTHTVETGNEFSINDDERTGNYELNVARHAFSCSMRSVRLLQYPPACMRSMPWLYTSSFDVSILLMLLGFPTWAQNGVTFRTFCCLFCHSSFSVLR
jgi:hypothetical protein